MARQWDISGSKCHPRSMHSVYGGRQQGLDVFTHVVYGRTLSRVQMQFTVASQSHARRTNQVRGSPIREQSVETGNAGAVTIRPIVPTCAGCLLWDAGQRGAERTGEGEEASCARNLARRGRADGPTKKPSAFVYNTLGSQLCRCADARTDGAACQRYKWQAGDGGR